MRAQLKSVIRKPMIESLKGRRLLTADLTGTFFGVVPAALKVTGSNHVMVRLSNVGDSLASGSATVTLYLSSTATLESGDTALLPVAKAHVHLKAGAVQNVPVTFISPGTAATGAYYLLGDIIPSAAVGDTDTANNVFATSGTLSVQQPIVDLTASVTKSISGAIAVVSRHQKAASATITVTNSGNITAKGKLVVDLYAATHTTLNSSDTLLVSKTLGNAALAAGKSRKYTISILPGSKDPSGTFYLLADVNGTRQPKAAVRLQLLLS